MHSIADDSSYAVKIPCETRSLDLKTNFSESQGKFTTQLRGLFIERGLVFVVVFFFFVCFFNPLLNSVPVSLLPEKRRSEIIPGNSVSIPLYLLD